MCKFFSFCTIGRRYLYFNWEQRRELIKSNPKNLAHDSHASIAEFFGVIEDKCNKFEYNPLTNLFVVDQINGKKDNSEAAEKWVKQLDFKEICRPLILKKIIDPFKDFNRIGATKTEIEFLRKWASASASVWDSVWDSVWASASASVGDSASASVWASVWDSVWDSVWASAWAYVSSFFEIVYEYDFSPCVELWKAGLVPSFDGTTWRLHGEHGKIVFEMKG